MIQVKAIIEDDSGHWVETLKIPEVFTSAREEVQKIVDKFNDYLQPWEKERRLVMVRNPNWSIPPVLEHDWHKTNLVSINKGGRIYDTYRCNNCGVTGKRFGLSQTVIYDRKFAKDDKYQTCNWKVKQ